MQAQLLQSGTFMHPTKRPGGARAPGKGLSRASAQRASVAQQLLVTRLQARNRRDLSVEMMERGAHVLWVTCKAWFASGEAPPPAADTEGQAGNPNETNDAHRDR
jgi:hypothetical protein